MPRRLDRFFRDTPGRTHQVLPELQHANQLMAAENYQAAAAAFEDLARQAKDRQGRRAPFFILQAGQARLMTGEIAQSLVHFKYGLILLADAQRYTQFYRLGKRIIHELKARKLEKEGQEVSDLIHGHTIAIAEMATQQVPSDKTLPPTNCPACGGPIRADEVEWIDDLTAECPFCDSPVRAGP
jgi:hypothetical protein